MATTTEGVSANSVALPTKTDEELVASWPARWVKENLRGKKGFSQEDLLLSQRFGDALAEEVREETLFTFNGYALKGWGADEITPLDGKRKNWVKIGVMILDSLDTLHIMQLTHEFQKAKKFVEQLNFKNADG